MRRHAGKEVVDELVGDEGVAEVELSDIWLDVRLARPVVILAHIPFHQRPL